MTVNGERMIAFIYTLWCCPWCPILINHQTGEQIEL
jgi:hypothetical protein